MRNYEKFSDSLDKKMSDYKMMALAFAGLILIRPLGLCTDAIFRRNLGERFFGLGTASLSFYLWCLPGFLLRPDEGIKWNFLRNVGLSPLASWLAHQTNQMAVGTVVVVVFFICVVRNLTMIWERQKKGIVWYSMSRGESVFGTESRLANGIFIYAIGVVLFGFAPPCGLLFFASRIASAYLYNKEQQSVYNRYLDEQDARILLDKLEPAMIGGKTPRQTDGLYCPLPKRFKGEHRVRVAKVASGVLERATARSEAANAEKRGAAAAGSAAPLPSFFPTKQQWKENFDESLGAAARNLEEGVEITKKVNAQAQRYRGVFVFFGIVVVGILAVRFAALHWPHHATAPVNTPKTEMPHPAANRETPVSAAPTPAVPPPAASVPTVAKPALAVSTIATPAPATPTIATPIPAVSRPVTPPVASNPPADTKQTLKDPPEHQNGVAAEIDALDKFENYCETTFNNEQARARQLPDNSSTDRIWKQIPRLGRDIQAIWDSQEPQIKKLRPGVPADEAAARALPPMLASRQSATNALLRLHNQIDAAMNK